MAVPAQRPHGVPYPHDGLPQGCVVIYDFSNSTGWLSSLVTSRPYRGYSLGRELFQAGMDYFRKHNTQYIGLDSVVEQREMYERRGFFATDVIAICERPNVKDIPSPRGALLQGEKFIDLRLLTLDSLAKSDLAHCGLDRSRLWTDQALFRRNDAGGLAVLDKNDTLKGWVLVRRCESGYRFGPIYAERTDLASLLLHAAMQSLEDKDASLIAETWCSNKDAVPTFENMGWNWTISFHRMWYDKKVPAAQLPEGRAARGTYAVFDAAQG